MTPTPIHEDFKEQVKIKAAAAFRDGHYRVIFGREGFEKGAEWAYRLLSDQGPRWVKLDWDKKNHFGMKETFIRYDGGQQKAVGAGDLVHELYENGWEDIEWLLEPEPPAPIQ